MLAVLLKQPLHSRYYEWARKKQMYVVLFMFAYIMSALILLKVNKRVIGQKVCVTNPNKLENL